MTMLAAQNSLEYELLDGLIKKEPLSLLYGKGIYFYGRLMGCLNERLIIYPWR